MEDYPVSKHHTFPCQQCGAQLTYQPGSNQLICGHCGHGHDIEVSWEPILEYDFHSTLQDLSETSESHDLVTVKCDSCSAETTFDANLNSDECPFCGSKMVAETHAGKLIRPKSLLPFKISSNQASEQYKSWLKGLWFAPNRLKKYARRERRLNGVYVPYWTYDCNTATRYQGQRGDVYQVPQKVSVIVNGRRRVKTRMVSKIRWSPASGSVSRNFDDVIVYATDSLPRSMARELAPWDLGSLVPYQEEFLSGFQSEFYKIDIGQGFSIAKERMHPVIRQDIRRQIGGDHQRIHSADTSYSRITYKHILLPFWIAGFRFRNKVYQFIVNGRTGEVQGDRPFSWIKIFFATAAVAAIAATVIYFGVDSGLIAI